MTLKWSIINVNTGEKCTFENKPTKNQCMLVKDAWGIQAAHIHAYPRYRKFVIAKFGFAGEV